MQSTGREPSMEDILASIKKVIAEEKELRAAARPVAAVEDELLPAAFSAGPRAAATRRRARPPSRPLQRGGPGAPLPRRGHEQAGPPPRGRGRWARRCSCRGPPD